MSQEIVYTSAPSGLKPGSRGYCTVISTFGMAKTLCELLESLSGYLHRYPPHTAEARLNPVNYSHLLLTMGGWRYHLLSRIADAGVDYSGRTNKLAHHVVLDTEELVAGGPAWVMAQPDFMVQQFSGEPAIVPAGRKPPVGDWGPVACLQWQRAAGDAGWGGALAETALRKPAQPAVIVFRPGTDMLPLIVEALALLPPAVRWNVSFSTYFTKLPPSLECQWRCVVEGTAEAKAAVRLPNALVINLCAPLGNAVGGELVDAARTGAQPRWPQSHSHAEAPAAESMVQVGPMLRQDATTKCQPSDAPVKTRRTTAPALAEIDLNVSDDLPSIRPYQGIPQKKRSSSSAWKVAAVALLLIAGIAGGFMAGLAVGRHESRLLALTNTAPAQEAPSLIATRPTDPTRSQESDPASKDPSHPATSPAANATPDNDRSTTGSTAVVSTDAKNTSAGQATTPGSSDKAATSAPAQPPSAAVIPVAKTAQSPSITAQPIPDNQNVFKDIEEKNFILPLPPTGTGKVNEEKVVKVPLATLPVADPKHCELSLIGIREAFSEMSEPPEFTRSTDKPHVWNLLVKDTSQVGGNKIPVAAFLLEQNSLVFTWINPKLHSVNLRDRVQNCMLKIRIGKQTCPSPIALRAPIMHEPAGFNFVKSPQVIALPSPELSPENEKQIQIKFDESSFNTSGLTPKFKGNQLSFPVEFKPHGSGIPPYLRSPIVLSVKHRYDRANQTVNLSSIAQFYLDSPQQATKGITLTWNDAYLEPTRSDKYVDLKRIWNSSSLLVQNCTNVVSEKDKEIPALVKKHDDALSKFNRNDQIDTVQKIIDNPRDTKEELDARKRMEEMLELKRLWLDAARDLAKARDQMNRLRYIQRIYEIISQLQVDRGGIRLNYSVVLQIRDSDANGKAISHPLVLFQTGPVSRESDAQVSSQ